MAGVRYLSDPTQARVVPVKGYWGSTLKVVVDARSLGKTAAEVAKELFDGDPSIRVSTEGDDTVTVNAHALNEGEETVVAERLRDALIG